MAKTVGRIEDKETHEWHYSGWFEYAKALSRWGKKPAEAKNAKQMIN